MNPHEHRDDSAKSAPPPPKQQHTLPAKLQGILIPFTTPFDAEDEVDLEALRANIRRWNKTGVAGYVALGSTGERVHLSEDERVRVIEAARESAPRETAFVAGVGAHSTRETLREAASAQRAGADALLVITPHFYRGAMTQEALYEHYLKVADAARAPVVLYNIPQNTGVSFAPETVARLAEHENVAGIKDSSGDMVNFVEMLRLAGRRDDFALTVGHASALFASLASGASGAILAAACVAPKLCVEIYRATRAGEHERALSLQERLLPVARAVTTRYGIGGLKRAMDLRGYAGGAARAPLKSPDEAARAEIARLVEETADFEAEASSSASTSSSSRES